MPSTSTKVKNGSLLRADFKSGQIPAGPGGPRGPGGPGRSGGRGGRGATSLWAAVDATGTLIRNKGASSTQKLGTGDYLIIFNQDVTNCVYQATIGGPTTNLFPGQVSAAQRVALPAGVRVITMTSIGTRRPTCRSTSPSSADRGSGSVPGRAPNSAHATAT